MIGIIVACVFKSLKRYEKSHVMMMDHNGADNPKPPAASGPLWLRDSNMVLCDTEIREP